MRTIRRTGGLLAGLAFAGAAQAAPVTSVSSTGALVTVDSAAPGAVLRSTPLSGLGTGQSLVSIDARPATGGRVLYGLSNAGQLYAINPVTGGATAIGAPIASVAVQGNLRTEIDFNPTVDRIRVVNASGLNLRVNPDTGAVAAFDGTLNAAVVSGTGPAVFGISGAAYTNNVAGATTTTLYVLQGNTGQIGIQNPPNAGTITLFGRGDTGNLGATSPGAAGFDISGQTGQALATVTNAAGVTSLYSVNLQSGLGTLLGTYGAGGTFTGLTFTPATFASSAGSANQRSVATAIDSWTGVPSSRLVSLFNSLDTLGSNADRSTAYSRLGPNQYSILPEVAFQTNEFVENALRRYLRDARGGGTGNSDPTRTQNTDRAVGGFLVGSGRYGKFYRRGDREDVRYNSSGVIGGVDVRLSPTVLIGATGGFDFSSARLNAQSRNSDVKTYFGGGYGTFGLGPFYIDLTGNYGSSKYYLRRAVLFGNFADADFARTKSTYYAGSATSGFSFDFSGFETEIYGGARYAHVNVRSFGENGGISALTVGRQKVESFQSIAGLRLGADYDMFGAHVRPSVRGEWRHEFKNDDPRLLTATFGPGTGISAVPITYTTSPLGQNFAVVGAGLTISGNSPISVVIDYHGQFYGGYHVNSAQVGARMSF